jgi:hypothetical protein
MNASLILVLVGTSTCAQAERVTCAVNADTWVDAPPSEITRSLGSGAGMKDPIVALSRILGATLVMG